MKVLYKSLNRKKKHKYYVSTQVFLNFDESFKNEVIVKNCVI